MPVVSRYAASRHRHISTAPAQRTARADERVERELRRILIATLEALKNPAAIPSEIIGRALREARRI